MEFWSTILLSATIAAIAAMGLSLQIRNGQMNVGWRCLPVSAAMSPAG